MSYKLNKTDGSLLVDLVDGQLDTTSSDLGAVVLEKDPEVKEPPSYQVILLNDDYTPMEFVVYVLQIFFGFLHWCVWQAVLKS